jgi:mono/diheme cytochrome c family protein
MNGVIALLILSEASLAAQPTSGRQVFAKVPESARPAPNPLANDGTALAQGRKLYQQNCAMCHGATGGGSKLAPPLTGSDMKAAAPGEIFWVISTGVAASGMPSWSRLTETQRWQIVTFLKSLSASPGAGDNTAKGTAWSPSAPIRHAFSRVPEKARPKCNPLTNDKSAGAAGAKLFQQHCSQCHGKTAEGRSKAPALINAAMIVATPGEIFWVITNGVVRRGMPSWSRLPEIQRWQIVTYLESLNRPPGSDLIRANR